MKGIEKDQAGLFDIIGDIHGCANELLALLGKLGWERQDRARSEPP